MLLQNFCIILVNDFFSDHFHVSLSNVCICWVPVVSIGDLALGIFHNEFPHISASFGSLSPPVHNCPLFA